MPHRAALLVALLLIAAAGCADATPAAAPVSKAAKMKESMKNEDGTPMKPN